MSGHPPFFSVVTPSFNQASWIGGCIESVLAQGTDDFEHIIFDNCSSDGTAAVVARHPHVLWHCEADRGQSHALNKAMALARGEVICWLNADDRYMPGAFEIVRSAFADPTIDVVWGDAEEVHFDGRGAALRTARFERREDLLFWWEKRTDLLQPSVFFRRRVLARTGPLREDLHVIMDTELWWRMSEHHRFHYLAKALSVQQRLPDSKTMRHVERIYEEKARVFGPLLREAYPQRLFRHWVASRCGMGRRYLGLAQTVGSTDRRAALRFLGRSVRENPLLVLTFCWWKALLCLARFRSRGLRAASNRFSPIA